MSKNFEVLQQAHKETELFRTAATPPAPGKTERGAVYLSAVCILPEILISQYAVPFYFGGTSLLIVVSVTMDTVAQIHSHLLAHQYEGLIKKAKLRGRRRRWFEQRLRPRR